MSLRITSIYIQNFRSIRSLTIRPAELAILVGRNDVGKSNVLRALNLFFTGFTSPETPLDFDNDHNVFNEPNRRAKEVRITLEIALPESYRETNGDFIVWEKRWRRESDQPVYETYSGRRKRETRRHTTVADVVEIPPRSRVHGLLHNINYVYVPAIKDIEYFGGLRAKIYEVVAEAAAKTFHDSSQAFEHSISDHLRDLTDEIRNSLGFESRLALPRDLSHVFESLDFLSADTDISLESRGDGIKARHIPMILKFMADKMHSLDGRGTVPHTFIWGYEEPENSLELVSCVELVDQLQAYAQEGIAQIFLTTHSPVFYNQASRTEGDDNTISRHHVILDHADHGSQELTNPSSLDERMGTMIAYAPLIRELEAQIRLRETARREAEDLAASHRPKLFVEGPPDKLILEKSLHVFAPERAADLDIETVADGGGWRYVLDKLSGWRSNAKHDQQMSRAAGVIDCDKEALAGLKEWNKVPTNVESAKCFSLPTPQHLHQPLQSGFRIRVDLEALYDYEAWKWADRHRHLECRKKIADVIPEDLNQRILREEATLAGALDDTWSIFVTKKFVQAGKLPMAQHFSQMNDEEFSRRMASVAKLVKEIVAYLFP